MARTSLTLTPASAGTIAIDPFPFDQAPLEAAVVYRRLPPAALRDADTFKAAYFGARPQTAVVTFVASH